MTAGARGLVLCRALGGRNGAGDAVDRTVSGAFTAPGIRAKWRGVSLTERAAAQSHFIDLCRALCVPVPTECNTPRSVTVVAVA